MDTKIWGQNYQNTVICVDSYDGRIPVGVVSDLNLKETKPFRGVVQLLKEMDRKIDGMNLPQPSGEMRAFAVPPLAEEPSVLPQEAEHGGGKLATFTVNVIFRQNAGWQGTVTWVDRRREESFRSVLELIVLMDSALRAPR